MKQTLITFIAGGLMTGVTLGTLGYFKINVLNKENTRLQAVVKKQNWRLENLNKNQTRLKEELDWLKEKKDQEYDKTIGALMQAKENASIEALYEMGLKAMAEKDHPRAYFALAQVVKANPKYKAAEKHYAESKKAYSQHQQTLFEDKLKITYLKAFDQQANNQFAQAKINYQQVLDMKPDFKEAKVRLETVTRQLEVRKQTRDLEQKKQWLEATYKLGFNHQANGRYAQAKDAYEKILNYAPKYKDTAKRLNAVITKLPKTPPVVQSNPPAVQAQANTQTPQAVAAQNQICYEKGMEFGKCSSMGNKGQNCSHINISHPPVECKDNLEFKRGFKSTFTSGSTTLLRGLSDFLKNL